ncbi:MAG TPA: hypothetical protein VFO87_12845 [Nitrospira sp.]|nr:hypothetical protein [Nitrospira sp.]
MTDATIKTLRKMVIDTKEELTNARYHLDGLDLIFESLPDKRVAGACMSIFSTADKKLEAVDDMLDDLYRHISSLERELAEAARDDEADD